MTVATVLSNDLFFLSLIGEGEDVQGQERMAVPDEDWGESALVTDLATMPLRLPLTLVEAILEAIL